MPGPTRACRPCRCEHNIANECERDPDACWHTERHGEALTACVDNLAAYQASAASSVGTTPGVALSYCDCAALPGCWRHRPNGECEEACFGGDCDADTKLCAPSAASNSGSLDFGAIAWTPGALR